MLRWTLPLLCNGPIQRTGRNGARWDSAVAAMNAGEGGRGAAATAAAGTGRRGRPNAGKAPPAPPFLAQRLLGRA